MQLGASWISIDDEYLPADTAAGWNIAPAGQLLGSIALQSGRSQYSTSHEAQGQLIANMVGGLEATVLTQEVVMSSDSELAVAELRFVENGKTLHFFVVSTVSDGYGATAFIAAPEVGFAVLRDSVRPALLTLRVKAPDARS